MSKIFKPKLLVIPGTPVADVLNISGDFQLICETHTGNDFDNIIIACVRCTDGNTYDVLFTSDLDALPIAENCATVDKLSKYYNKRFVRAVHGEIPCLAFDHWTKKN